MTIGGITLNFTNTTVSVIVIVAIVLYTWFTKDQEAVDGKEERGMHT